MALLPQIRFPVDLRPFHARRRARCPWGRTGESARLLRAASSGWLSPDELPFDCVSVKSLRQTPSGAWQPAFQSGHATLGLSCNCPHRCWHLSGMLARHCLFRRASKDLAGGQTGGGEPNMGTGGSRDVVGHENETDVADVRPPLRLRQGRSPTRQHQAVPRTPPQLLISRGERKIGCGARAVPCRTGRKLTGGTRRAMMQRKESQRREDRGARASRTRIYIYISKYPRRWPK